MKRIILFAILSFVGFTTHAQKDTIQNFFIENFNDSTLNNFKYGSTGNKANFKWKSG
jgi:hypothetical protein